MIVHGPHRTTYLAKPLLQDRNAEERIVAASHVRLGLLERQLIAHALMVLLRTLQRLGLVRVAALHEGGTLEQALLAGAQTCISDLLRLFAREKAPSRVGLDQFDQTDAEHRISRTMPTRNGDR